MNRVVEGYATFRRSGLDVLVAGRERMVKRVRAAAPLAEAVST